LRPSRPSARPNTPWSPLRPRRDIKPSNLLLNSECQVKLADFGLARSIAQIESETATNPVLTDYVATRWYRAPEILLGSTRYTRGVDMWSCGCILGELLSGKPIFPGSSTMNQLDRILEVTGRPKKADIDAVGSSFAMTMLDELPTPKQRNLEHMFPNASPEATDLLRKLLVFNPDKRMTAEEALSHPYVAQFHDPATEPRCSRVITIPINDNTKFTIQEYRERLYQEIVRRKKELKRRIKERDAQRAASKGKDLQQVQKEVEQAQVLARTPSTTDGSKPKRRWWAWGSG